MKKTLLLLLKGYKKFISPYLVRSCRFHPTCSEYAIEAVERFGVMKGTALALWRLLRCNPLSRGGYDPAVRQQNKGMI
ncbi:MAG: membrane protein insertion efficiency factor YidD [Candidatus Omnitrophota bacterium]